MKRRLARWRLETALRDRLFVQGARLLVRSQDVLLSMEGEWLRLVPRRGRLAPHGVSATGSFLVFPRTGSLSKRALDRLRRRDTGGLDAIAAEVLVNPPSTTIHVGGNCEQACRFCREAPLKKGPDRPRPFRSLLPLLERARSSSERVLLRGDDVLGHPELVKVVEQACEMGFASVGLLCPGPRLVDGELAERLARAGLDVIEVPLYGSAAAAHDAVVRCEGAFERLMAGLSVLRRAGVQVIVHTALTRDTLPALADMARLCFERGLCFERLEGLVADEGGAERYRNEVPDVQAVREALEAAWDELPLPMELVNLPPCALPEGKDGLHVRPPHEKKGRLPLVQAEPCRNCPHRKKCPGLPEPYWEKHTVAL